MIHRLRKVTKGLYRGSAPTPNDVVWLKNELNINKIVSLDLNAGNSIDRTTQILHIDHIIIPIDIINLRQSLFALFKHDLKSLLLDGGPTYVHCLAGKDRTGFVIALFKCKYMGMNPNDAIKEAKSLGFGIDVDARMISLFEKLIRQCKPITDNNSADIVSNEREYIGDNRDSFLDEGHQGSFAPYISKTRQNPMDMVYNPINDQSPTRENYDSYRSIKEQKSKNNIPLIGIYNNDAGIHGAGPAEPVGGFIYE